MIEYGHITIASPFEMSFIPSLENINKIGSPQEIIETVSDVYSLRERHFLNNIENPTTDLINSIKKTAGKSALRASLVVLYSCCDRDPSKLVGHFKENGHYAKGIESFENIIELAKALLKNGVVGKSARKSTHDNSKKSNKFDAVYYINIARVHLKLSREESSRLTMTELIMLMEAMHPEEDTGKVSMSKEEYKEKMAKAKAIQAKIISQRGGK